MEKCTSTISSDPGENKQNHSFGIGKFARMLRENGFKDPSPRVNRLQRTYYIVIPDTLNDSEGARSMSLIKPGKGQVDIFKKSGSWVAWVKNLDTGDHDRVSVSASGELLLEENCPGKIKEIEALLFGVSKEQ